MFQKNPTRTRGITISNYIFKRAAGMKESNLLKDFRSRVKLKNEFNRFQTFFHLTKHVFEWMISHKESTFIWSFGGAHCHDCNNYNGSALMGKMTSWFGSFGQNIFPKRSKDWQADGLVVSQKTRVRPNAVKINLPSRQRRGRRMQFIE